MSLSLNARALRAIKWTAAVLVALGLFNAGAQAQQASVLARAKTRSELRIATSDTLKPWGYLDAANQSVGYNVDVSNELAKRMGLGKVTFVLDTYKNFISGLNADRYDIVVAILTPTEERRKAADFSVPYMVVTKNIFVKDDNQTIHGLADLKGKRLGVAGGTEDEAWARKNIPEADIRVYDNFQLAFQDLAVGRIDARLTDRVTGMTAAREGRFQVKIAGDNLAYDIGTIAFKKDQPDMTVEVNRVLGDMIADGTINEISKKWLPGIEMGTELQRMPKSALR